MKFKFPAILVVAVTSIAALVWYSRPISVTIVQLFFGHKDPSPIEKLASVSEVKGQVSILRSGRPPSAPLQTGDPIFHLDQIQLGANGEAEIDFKSGWSILLSPTSSATIEAYRPNENNSPVVVSFQYGSYKLVSLGPLGLLYVADQKGVRSPETATPEENKKPILMVDKPKVNNQKNNDESLVNKSQFVNSPNPNGYDPELSNQPLNVTDKIKVGARETLSVNYIETVLGSLSQNFRKCQMNSLRDQQLATASLLMTLTIAPKGSVESVGVLQSNTKDKNLENCAIGVLRRARFRSFNGNPISLTYPLEFK